MDGPRSVGQDDGEPPVTDPLGGGEGDAPGAPLEDGSDADRAARRDGTCGHRTTSRWRWNRAPRSHRRSACQWIISVVLWVTSGCRRTIRTRFRSVNGRRTRSRLACRTRPSGCSWLMVIRSRVRLVADPDGVGAVRFHERRDVERLPHRSLERRGPVTRPQRVEMALAMGVVDLHDHDPERALRVTAEVEAGRVEHVAEHARVRDERDLPSAGVLAVRPKVLEERRPQIRRGRIEMIAVPHVQDPSSVATEQPRDAVDVVELVQVERHVVDPMLEGVHERSGATMPDHAFQEMRSHAARSSIRPMSPASAAMIRWAASSPDRQPSSWKP